MKLIASVLTFAVLALVGAVIYLTVYYPTHIFIMAIGWVSSLVVLALLGLVWKIALEEF